MDRSKAEAAARQVALNIVAQLDVACRGDMSRIGAIMGLGGYINAALGFTVALIEMNAALEVWSF